MREDYFTHYPSLFTHHYAQTVAFAGFVPSHSGGTAKELHLLPCTRAHVVLMKQKDSMEQPNVLSSDGENRNNIPNTIYLCGFILCSCPIHRALLFRFTLFPVV